MKSLSRFLVFALALISSGAVAGPVATTAGSNLTAYNPNSGAINNNTWNNLTNPRSGADSAPTADFGNCNALILRCATPKCSSGGCTDMSVTSAIVQGCVNSNDTCKKYGDDLVNYISAQLVAQSTAKSNQAAMAAQNAATQQNNQQMQAMAQQMAQLQQQIASQNDAMVAALEAQQQATAQAIADATVSAASAKNDATTPVESSISVNTELTDTQRIAAESGVSEDLLLREQISGEILTQIENAEKSLKELKATMNAAFEYAGCDSRGDNCTGPKRVSKFKELANKFFDPYEDVLDDLYEAIILSQSVGVDVSNIYMMLNNSCERWGQYACVKPMYSVVNPTTGKPIYAWPRYDQNNCRSGKSIAGAPIITNIGGGNYSNGSVRGGQECYEGQTIPPEDDTSCTLINVLSGDSADNVSRGYLYPDEGDMGDMVRVGCASNALKGSWLFKGKKQQATIDIETLQRILNQDASKVSLYQQVLGRDSRQEQLKYCALTRSGYMNLQKYVSLRGLPKRDICVTENKLNANMQVTYISNDSGFLQQLADECTNKGGKFSNYLHKCYCFDSTGSPATAACDSTTSQNKLEEAETNLCQNVYGAVYDNGHCYCEAALDYDSKENCAIQFLQPLSNTTFVIDNSRLAQECTTVGGTWDNSNAICTCGSRTIYPYLHRCDSGVCYYRRTNGTDVPCN